MKLRIVFSALLVTMMSVSSAYAVLIDFTSRIWSDIEGQTSSTTKTINGVDVTLQTLLSTVPFINTSYTPELTWNETNPAVVNPFGLDGNGDGIGTKHPASQGFLGLADEVSWQQSFRVSFSPDVVVETIYAFDIDSNDYVRYMLEGGSWVNSSTGGGMIAVTTGSNDYVSWIDFAVDDAWQSRNNSFAVAGLEVNPVPEPTTLLLFGTGIAGLAAIGRRRK